MDLIAQVAQHLCGLSLPDEHTDFTGLLEELAVGEPGHGWEERDLDLARFRWDGHTIRSAWICA